jgi:DNA-binding response OmpR family regulator
MKASVTAGTTVDIYEEDRTSRDLIQQWLNDAGYRVRNDGGSRAQPDKPVDLVILATQLPTAQTLGVIRTMRLIYPTTAFLVLPRQDTPEASVSDTRARSMGATRVLCRPLTRQHLLEAARAVTNDRTCRPAARISFEMNA